MATADLWPADIVVKVKGPVTILKEQATFLGQRTKNVVTAEVVRRVSIDTVKFAFYIVGPAIHNYRWRLFTMSYGAEFYPLDLEIDPVVLQELRHVETPLDATDMCAASRADFLAILREVFAANRTLSVIRAILALSGAEPSE